MWFWYIHFDCSYFAQLPQCLDVSPKRHSLFIELLEDEDLRAAKGNGNQRERPSLYILYWLRYKSTYTENSRRTHQQNRNNTQVSDSKQIPAGNILLCDIHQSRKRAPLDQDCSTFSICTRCCHPQMLLLSVSRTLCRLSRLPPIFQEFLHDRAGQRRIQGPHTCRFCGKPPRSTPHNMIQPI